MKKNEFIYLLLGVSYATFKVTQKQENKRFITDFKYNLHLNQSFDENIDNNSFYYPEDNGKIFTKINELEVSEILCRNEALPVWIDIYIIESNNNSIIFDLVCSGRYSNDNSIFYSSAKGSGPFAIKIKEV